MVPFHEIADELRRDHPDVYGGMTNEQVRKKSAEFFVDIPVDLLEEYVKAKVPNSDANVALCVDTRISDAEMNHVLAEYATDYRSAWWRAMAEHAGMGVLLWLVPGVALYALGWGVVWIRRGFMS